MCNRQLEFPPPVDVLPFIIVNNVSGFVFSCVLTFRENVLFKYHLFIS